MINFPPGIFFFCSQKLKIEGPLGAKEKLESDSKEEEIQVNLHIAVPWQTTGKRNSTH